MMIEGRNENLKPEKNFN